MKAPHFALFLLGVTLITGGCATGWVVHSVSPTEERSFVCSYDRETVRTYAATAARSSDLPAGNHTPNGFGGFDDSVISTITGHTEFNVELLDLPGGGTKVFARLKRLDALEKVNAFAKALGSYPGCRPDEEALTASGRTF